MIIWHQLALVLIAATAAFTDVRRGEIPNWLTLPALAAAPLIHLVVDGVPGLLTSLIGVVGCGLVPYLFFRSGLMGGGDVKLFAALGAIGGVTAGMETLLFSHLLAFAFAMVRVLSRGQLRRTLVASWTIFANIFRRASQRREVVLGPDSAVRLGPFVLAGLLVVLVRQWALI
jgi:prepilin peptidase CpaA